MTETKTKSTVSILTAPEPYAIEVDSLCKTYAEGFLYGNRLQALKDVSFKVRQGEIFGLLGPNGAGKTTFLKILLGIIRKTKGSATMLGFPAGSQQGRKQVGYLPEQFRVPAHLTGYGALDLYGQVSNTPRRIIHQKRDELINLVGLTGRAKDRVKKYSKGMKQRLGLAQALLHDPKLLVLDEPTDGLDPRARAEMRQIIRNLKERGVTVFLNSHLLQEVEMICDQVAILNRGVLQYCGAVDQIGQHVSQLALKPGEPLDSSTTSLTIDLTIEGNDPEALQRCFQELEFEIKSHHNVQYQIEVTLADQSAIDRLIDQLRAESISIISLERSKVSLEDAFLTLVNEDDAPHSNESN